MRLSRVSAGRGGWAPQASGTLALGLAPPPCAVAAGARGSACSAQPQAPEGQTPRPRAEWTRRAPGSGRGLGSPWAWVPAGPRSQRRRLFRVGAPASSGNAAGRADPASVGSDGTHLVRRFMPALHRSCTGLLGTAESFQPVTFVFGNCNKLW